MSNDGKPFSLRQWEAAEIERSAVEASQTSLSEEALREDESNVARYLSPPADTPFPLEYCYHLLGDVCGQHVVDLGCGTGGNSLLLARRGANVEAIDISPELIAIAQRRMLVNGITGGVTFHTASVYDLPLPDNSVDVVFGMVILHHLDLRLAARETLRVLRPGGRAIFREPVRNAKLFRLVRKLFPNRAADVSPFERPLTDAELQEFAHGFSAYRARSFYSPLHMLARKMLGWPKSDIRLARADAHLLKRFPKLDWYASVKVFELMK